MIGTLALTSGQELTFAILGLIAVAVFVVWPACHRQRRHYVERVDRSHASNRLLREIERHDK